MMHEQIQGAHYFPILLALRRARAIVVGGGAVAERKVRSLLECGASVTVISPRLKEGLSRLASENSIVHIERAYSPGDLDGAALAFVAISDKAASAAIARDAGNLNIPINVVDQPELCTFIVPAVVRRGHLTIAVSTEGASPAWARRIKQQITDTFGEEYAGLFDALAAVRLSCLREIPDPARRRRVLQKLADDSLVDLARSMDARSLETLLCERARRWAEEDDDTGQEAERMTARGRAWLVGAGPGDPELITLRGVHALEQADVVLYDRLVAKEILAFARPGVELVNVGKRRGNHSVPQDKINRLLIDHVRQGKNVVRLKSGDPFVFGRGGEEAEALAAAGLAFEVIPGITAAVAAGAAFTIPLTKRGVSSCVTLVTGHEDPAKEESGVNWAALEQSGGTIVIYMGMAYLERMVEKLIASGFSPDTPAAIICKATMPGQTSVAAPLERLPAAAAKRGLTPPSVVIIGPVVPIVHNMD